MVYETCTWIVKYIIDSFYKLRCNYEALTITYRKKKINMFTETVILWFFRGEKFVSVPISENTQMNILSNRRDQIQTSGE